MIKCPLCISLRFKRHIRVNNYDIVRCSNCGILFTKFKSRLETKIINSKVYGDEYINNYNQREEELVFRFKRHLNEIEKLTKGGKILDVGCSAGLFLRVVEKYGIHEWKTYGIEMNNKLTRLARKLTKNATIYNRNIAKLKFTNQKFDCVTCFDVLEHHNKFVNNIQRLNKILSKDGILVIQSPNYKSLMASLTKENWDWWSPPDHVLHFSNNFLVNFLNTNGFTVIRNFTYEPTKDFLLNIRGTCKSKIKKILFYILFPFLLLFEKISEYMGYGALSFIIARKL